MADQLTQTQLLGAAVPFAVAAPTGGYYPFTDLAGASPHEAEILAFGLCNSRLAAAKDCRTRIEAVHKNQQLWSLLVRDLAREGNQLADALKQELIGLGFWAMRYGILANSNDLPLEPLIAVNRNILEGLKSQRASTPNHHYHASPDSPTSCIAGFKASA